MEKRSRREASDKMACLLCRGSDGLLREFRTLTADTSIRKMATQLKATQLLAALEGGDLIAIDAKYHLQCYTALRNRYRSHLRKLEQDLAGVSAEESQIKARALVELYTYIENCVEDGTFYFTFSKLHELYENRLKILGVEKEINRARELGAEKSLVLLVFHSFTGCDTTSSFFGRGKKSVWELWNWYPQVTRAFTYMALRTLIQNLTTIVNILN